MQGKVRVAPGSVKGEAVAVIDHGKYPDAPVFRYFVLSLVLFVWSAATVRAAVLPEDRTDVMGHYYRGGGLIVSGPAILARKGFDDKVSFSLTRYVDVISSASIDVVTTASKYSEKREETGVAMDYLYQDTLMNINYSVSDENDYSANTYGLGLAQEFFGGMTTLSMSYGRGADTVTKTTDLSFSESVDRDQYSFGITQVLTKHLLLTTSYEFISDIGFLNNPYRVVRIDAVGDRQNIGVQAEVYPNTRRSHAASVGVMQYLEKPARSSVRFNYRYFGDTWGIKADTFEAGYSLYLQSRKWLLDFRYRYYDQSKADFYQDFFAAPLTYMARDKELSTFTSQSIGGQASYSFLNNEHKMLGLVKGTINLSGEYLRFDYQNFSDLRTGSTYLQPYQFDAGVLELFVSLWY
jgi:Protein of unknown function (DUF3570)